MAQLPTEIHIRLILDDKVSKPLKECAEELAFLARPDVAPSWGGRFSMNRIVRRLRELAEEVAPPQKVVSPATPPKKRCEREYLGGCGIGCSHDADYIIKGPTVGDRAVYACTAHLPGFVTQQSVIWGCCYVEEVT